MKRQRTEGRKQRTDDRGRTTEAGRQRPDDRCQTTEVRSQRTERDFSYLLSVIGYWIGVTVQQLDSKLALTQLIVRIHAEQTV